MRCRTARTVAMEHRLGTLSSTAEAALQRHLQGCPACAVAVGFETQLANDLAGLRFELPGALDVRPRVSLEVSRLVSVERRDVPARQLGWAAAFAFALGGLLLVAVAGSLPEMLEALRQGRGLAAAGGEVLSGLWRPIAVLLSVPITLAQSLFGVLGAFGSTLKLMQPAATAAIWAAYTAMICTVVVVVGRDWLQRATFSVPKEP